jgi:hypothetical protein
MRGQRGWIVGRIVELKAPRAKVRAEIQEATRLIDQTLKKEIFL